MLRPRGSCTAIWCQQPLAQLLLAVAAVQSATVAVLAGARDQAVRSGSAQVHLAFAGNTSTAIAVRHTHGRKTIQTLYIYLCLNTIRENL